jgi:outer membrane protein assembly factor BamD (BamD/ComL family)
VIIKKIETVIIHMAFLVVCIFLTSVSHAADRLQIRIWADKNEYLTREPIFIHYEVKNITDSTIALNFRGLKDYFVIEDQDGRRFGSRLATYYAVVNPNSLKPDASYYEREEISDRYGLMEQGEYSCYIKLPPGPYSPSPETKSNLIKVEVKAPKGDEKKTLDLFLEAERLKWSPDKDPEKRALGFSKYLELVDKFPTSVYAPKALRSAWGVYIYSEDLKERRKIIPVCKRLIKSYPDSYYFTLAFTEIIDTYKILKDKEGAIKTMKELIEKHPNTKISERAEYWLEKIEKWEFK